MRACLAATVLGSLVACDVTVNDLEKWRNRPRSEERFVEWMLDPEATPDVRSKAIEMLFEQWEYGKDFIARVSDLPQGHRDQAIMDALPRLVDLYGGAEIFLPPSSSTRLRPVQARDGAILLMATTSTAEVRASISEQLIGAWLGDHYRACTTSVGAHANWQLFSMVGSEFGLPIMTGVITEGTHEEVVCQDDSLQQVSWLPEVSDALSQAYITRWENRRPQSVTGQEQLVRAMVRLPESQNLKLWMLQTLTSENAAARPDNLLIVDAFLEYIRPLAEPGDAERYARMIAIYEGNIRWLAFDQVLRLRGVEGILLALSSIPDAGVWGLWQNRVEEDGFQRAAEYICTRDHVTEAAAAARPRFEQALTMDNWIAVAIALHCLGEVGNSDSLEAIGDLNRNNVAIPSWGAEETTIGNLARTTIERINNR
jgi:hypothetical protein